MANQPIPVAAAHVDYETGTLRARTQLLDRLTHPTCIKPAAAAARSPREELFLRMQEAPGGTGFLVELRAHLLRGLREHPGWVPVEADLARALRSVFNRSRLRFVRLDAKTPEPILDKLIEYEAVHAIRNHHELRRRLEADRRCYAYFHPDWPGEPLVFTEVALTRGLSDKVQPLLDPASPIDDAAACDCAIFYSITNCQPGLRGFAFGNALILRVLDELRTELPGLRSFATLSPIPGFRSWLSAMATAAGHASRLASLVQGLDERAWSASASAAGELEALLVPLCALYLVQARHGGEPADPVARFHLGNGARLERINWMSDLSPAGLSRSAGLTANYVYQPRALARRHRAYEQRCGVCATRELQQLAQRAVRLLGRELPPANLPISA